MKTSSYLFKPLKDLDDLSGQLVHGKTTSGVFEQFFCKNAFLGNRAPAVDLGRQEFCPLCWENEGIRVGLDEEHVVLVCGSLNDVRRCFEFLSGCVAC